MGDLNIIVIFVNYSWTHWDSKTLLSWPYLGCCLWWLHIFNACVSIRLCFQYLYCLQMSHIVLIRPETTREEKQTPSCVYNISECHTVRNVGKRRTSVYVLITVDCLHISPWLITVTYIGRTTDILPPPHTFDCVWFTLPKAQSSEHGSTLIITPMLRMIHHSKMTRRI